jgi:hypothetical protein
VNWDPYAGATSYQLLRSSGGAAFATIATNIPTNSYVDNNVAAATTYLYRVKAVTASGTTDASNVDLATTVVFTNDDGLSGQTVLAAHLQQIRDAANMVLTAAGLPTISFGLLTSGVTPIQATDITVVRNALINAYYSSGLPIPNFSEPIVVGSTVVKAVHFQELRNMVK